MKHFRIGLLVGALSALSFQPVGLWPLMPLAVVGLCELIWRSKSLRHALAIGWGFGLGQFVVGLNWIATAFTYQAAMPAWLGWIAVVLLSLYLAVYPALATGLSWKFGRSDRFLLMLVLSGAWPIIEWLRATMFTGFAWNPVGFALVDTPVLVWAQFIGTYGLSCFLVFIAGAIWLAINGDKAPRNALIGFAALFLIMYFIPPAQRSTGKSIRVVQPNIGQEDKWREGYSAEAARRLGVLSVSPGGQHPRLLFWPEAAVTDPLEDARTGEHQAMAEYERTRAASLVGPGEYLLTGGIALFSNGGRTIDGAANSVFILGP